MTIHNLTYKPKEPSFSTMEAHREAGYVAKAFHMHDHHEISLITTCCSCRATCNGNSVSIRTPALVLTKAGSFHEIAEIFEGDFDSKVIFFHPQLMADIPPRLHHADELFRADSLILPLSQSQMEEYQPLFRLAQERKFPENMLMLMSILCHMDQMIESGNTPILNTAQRSYVFDIIELIQEHPEYKYAIAELAEKFHVSQTKLKTDFKHITGMPINSFCRQARLRKAVALLESTQMSQAQIAYDCGFSDESYFIDAFRKKYDVTPRTFRQQLKD